MNKDQRRETNVVELGYSASPKQLILSVINVRIIVSESYNAEGTSLELDAHKPIVLDHIFF